MDAMDAINTGQRVVKTGLLRQQQICSDLQQCVLTMSEFHCRQPCNQSIVFATAELSLARMEFLVNFLVDCYIQSGGKTLQS